MFYIIKKIIRFFDKLEDRVRGRLSKYPIVYTLIGGVCIVLFWRGVWHTADILMEKGGIWGFIFYEPFTLVWTSIVMLMTGLFVSFFIGESIVVSGLKHDKKIFEKTEEEVKTEEGQLLGVAKDQKIIEKDLESLSEKIEELQKK